MKYLLIAVLLIATPVMAQQFEKVDDQIFRKTEVVATQHDLSSVKERINRRLKRIAELEAENAEDLFLITEAAKVGVVEKAVEK